MIERQRTNPRMSRIVEHDGTVHLCGQVGAGADVAAQTRDCLARVEVLLAGSDLLVEVIVTAAVADETEGDRT